MEIILYPDMASYTTLRYCRGLVRNFKPRVQQDMASKFMGARQLFLFKSSKFQGCRKITPGTCGTRSNKIPVLKTNDWKQQSVHEGSIRSSKGIIRHE